MAYISDLGAKKIVSPPKNELNGTPKNGFCKKIKKSII